MQMVRVLCCLLLMVYASRAWAGDAQPNHPTEMRRTLAGGEAEMRNLDRLEQRISRQLEEVRRRPR